jgi:hypothetical protein
MIDPRKLNALRAGFMLAVEIEASCPDRRAWIAIRPFPGNQRQGIDSEDRTYEVDHYEFSRKHLEQRLDIAPRDGMWEVRSETVVTIQALMQLLGEWAVPLEDLRYSWNSGYPI